MGEVPGARTKLGLGRLLLLAAAVAVAVAAVFTAHLMQSQQLQSQQPLTQPDAGPVSAVGADLTDMVDALVPSRLGHGAAVASQSPHTMLGASDSSGDGSGDDCPYPLLTAACMMLVLVAAWSFGRSRRNAAHRLQPPTPATSPTLRLAPRLASMSPLELGVCRT